MGELLTNRRAYWAAQPGVCKSAGFFLRVCGWFTTGVFSLEFLFSSLCFNVVPLNNINCSRVMEHSLFYRVDSPSEYMKSL